MADPTTKEVLDYQITFGKHKGCSIKNLVADHLHYAMWVVGQGESNNKNFTKASDYIKLALDLGEDDVVIPAKKSASFKKVNLVHAPDGMFVYTWLSQIYTDQEFNFKLTEDSLQYALMLEKWTTYDTDFFIVVKRTGAGGDFLMKYMPRELLEFEKGRFMNVEAEA